MTVFLAYFALIFFFWALNFVNRHHNGPVKNLKQVTVVVLGVYLFLLAALRHSSVGIDTKWYVLFFSQIKRYNWAEIFRRYREFGYYGMNKIILIFTDNIQVLFGVIGGVYALGVSAFIRKYSKDVTLSFFMLIPMNFYYFSLCTLRQSMAMAVLLFSTPYIRRRKFPQFLAVLAVATTLHSSAPVFLLAYLIANKDITKRYLLIACAGIAGTMVFSPVIVRVLQALYPSYAGRFSGASATTLVLYAAILALLIIFKDDLLAADPLNKIYINLAIVTLYFQVLSLTLDVIFRIAFYFSIYFIASVPELFQTMRDKRLSTLLYIGFTVLMFVVYFGFTYDNAGVYPYRFFWQ